MSVKTKFQEKFLRTQKPVARWVNVIIICISSFLSIICYFIIEFMICPENTCANLKVMALTVKYSPVFIVYGISALFVANYIRIKEKIRVIYSDAIAFAITIGALFPILLALAVWREVGLNA